MMNNSTKKQSGKHNTIVIYALIILCLTIYVIFRQRLDVWFNPVTKHAVVSNDLPLQLIWSYTSPQPFEGKPISNEHITVLRISERKIKAFKNKSGQVLWEYDAPNTISYGTNLSITDSLVVGTSGKGNESFLFTLDNNTGKENWRVVLPVQLTRTPDVMVSGSTIIVAQRSKQVFVTGYNLISGQKLWDISDNVPKTGYSGMLTCSPVSPYLGDTVCLIFHEQVLVIEPQSGNLLKQEISPFSLHRNAIYSSDKFFASTNSDKAAVQVFDVEQNTSFSLPTTCTTDQFAHPVTISSSQVFISNGCDEAYILPITDLQTSPSWIYTSPIPLASSLVTLNNSFAFLLDNRGQIYGLDSQTGEVIGHIRTEPNVEMKDRTGINGLYANASYLYVVLDEGNLFVFEQLDYTD